MASAATARLLATTACLVLITMSSYVAQAQGPTPAECGKCNKRCLEGCTENFLPFCSTGCYFQECQQERGCPIGLTSRCDACEVACTTECGDAGADCTAACFTRDCVLGSVCPPPLPSPSP